MTYVCCLWGFIYAKQKDRSIKLQKRVARIITFSDFRVSSEQLFKLFNWIPFGKNIELETYKFIYKSLNGLSSDLKFFSFETKRNMSREYLVCSGKLPVSGGVTSGLGSSHFRFL
jgi:hypothetical protein